MPQINQTMGEISKTLGPTAQIFSAIGTGVQGFNQSRAADAEGRYLQQTYQMNADLARMQAEDAIDRGKTAVRDLKKQTKRLIGAQRAALAAQGIEVGDGSALDVQMDTAGQSAEDQLRIKNNAWREAYGYKTQAVNYESQGNFARLAGRNKSRNTIMTTGLAIAKDLSYSAYINKNKYVPRYGGYDE